MLCKDCFILETATTLESCPSIGIKYVEISGGILNFSGTRGRTASCAFSFICFEGLEPTKIINQNKLSSSYFYPQKQLSWRDSWNAEPSLDYL